jgi:hypothetical protein
MAHHHSHSLFMVLAAIDHLMTVDLDSKKETL